MACGKLPQHRNADNVFHCLVKNAYSQEKEKLERKSNLKFNNVPILYYVLFSLRSHPPFLASGDI